MPKAPEDTFFIFNVEPWHIWAAFALLVLSLESTYRNVIYFHVDPTSDLIVDAFSACVLAFYIWRQRSQRT
jgi:uncharacterized membrane protein YccC